MNLPKDFRLWEKIGFALFAVLTGSLVWITGYIPQSDGYYHAANAKLIVDLLTGDCPLAAQVYQFNDKLVPNWTGHALMALLIYSGTTILTAEKILLSLCLIMPALGFRYMLRQAQANIAYSWIVLGIGLNTFVIFGVYNYLLSIGLGLYCIGYYLRARQSPQDMLSILWMGLLLIATWFSHILGFLMVGLFIVLHEAKPFILSLKEKKTFLNYLQDRRWLVISSTPAIILTLIYFSQDFTQISFYTDQVRTKFAWTAFSGFLTLAFLQGNLKGFSIDLSVLQFILSLFVLITLLLATRKKSVSALGKCLLTTTLILVTLAAITDNVSLMGGWQISHRLLFPALLFLLFAAATLERSQAKAFILALSFLIFCENVDWMYRKASAQNKHAAEVLDHLVEARDNSLILNLGLANSYNAPNLINIVNQNKVCVIDVSNYEAAADIFPLRYRVDTTLLPISNNPFLVTGTDKYLSSMISMAPTDPDRFTANNHLPPIDTIYIWGDLALLKKELSDKKLTLNIAYFNQHYRSFANNLQKNLLKHRPLLYNYDHNGHHYLRIYGSRK